MPRPVDIAKRNAILEAAAIAFLERGYDATSIDIVADAAGAARRTVYHQFKSKEGLFDAVVQHLWSGLLPSQDVGGDGGADGREQVRWVATHIAAFWAQPIARSFLRLAIAEGPRFPTLRESYFRKGKQPVFNAIRARLMQLGQDGLLSTSIADDADLATHQLIGLVTESLLWPQLLGGSEPGEAERRRIIEGAVETFLARYGSRG